MLDKTIIFEDKSVLVVSKPRGLLTVAAKDNKKQKNLLDELKGKYEEQRVRLRPVNRIDRDTSGLVIFAKTKEAFMAIMQKQRLDKIEKTYLAIVTGILKKKEGEIKIPLPSRENPKVKIPAKTTYQVLREFRTVKASLIEARITSGKHHQIRKHFRILDHALLMDRDYMERTEYVKYQKIVPFRHFFLHSAEMDFTHPITGKKMHFRAELPEEFAEVLKSIK
ncbi:MAG: RluA family pseudouridine synthase [Candidatus Peregrinibacteria bacterium]|nr:RluA family pseudouridine synthase [Candidatus Peregrinibacteria bacterium]